MSRLQHETGLPIPELQLAMETLTQRGCVLERSPAGVALVSTAISCWRDVNEDTAACRGRQVGRRALVYSRTTSTNDIAWQHVATPEAEGLVVLADEQTAGRGRPGHHWQARAGQSVLLSLVKTGAGAGELNRLTLLAGLATARAVERMLESAGQPAADVEIKWPNDVLISGKKVAGILVERRAPTDAAAPVVIGVGLNVFQTDADFPPDLRGKAASLLTAGAAPPDRLDAAIALIDELADHLFPPPANEEAWIAAWKSRCPLLGKLVTARSGSQTVTGHVLDISPLHGLIVKDATGAQHFLSAQISSLL